MCFLLDLWCFVQYSVFKVPDLTRNAIRYALSATLMRFVALLFLHIMLQDAAILNILFETALLVIPTNVRHPPVLPCRLQQSTFGRVWLNRRVRYGYGCFPYTF